MQALFHDCYLVFYVGGCYSLVFRGVITQKMKEKYHGWVGPLLYMRVGKSIL